MAADLTVGGYYAVIPAPVLRDPHLRDRSKILYGEIVRLSSGHGFCYAKNRFLIDVLTYVDAETGAVNTISERTLQSLLSELREHGHIWMDMGPIPGRNGEIGRRIFVGQALAQPPTDGSASGGEENFTPRKKLRQRGEKNCTPYISPQIKGTKPPISPKEVLEELRGYAGDDADLLDALMGFAEKRAKKRNPIDTLRSVHILINKLDKLSGGKRDAKIAMLDNATVAGWSSVFALKPDEMPKTVSAGGEGEDRDGI
ncbi:hypothetical protein QVN85_01845 [Oscillibacter valericigenes]|nr:hypothetical protein [Oscillibacter valericigenes]